MDNSKLYVDYPNGRGKNYSNLLTFSSGVKAIQFKKKIMESGHKYALDLKCRNDDGSCSNDRPVVIKDLNTGKILTGHDLRDLGFCGKGVSVADLDSGRPLDTCPEPVVRSRYNQASSHLCESVTSQVVICQGRRYVRDQSAVSDRMNPVNKTLRGFYYDEGLSRKFKGSVKSHDSSTE